MGYFHYPAERVGGGRGHPSLLGDNSRTKQWSDTAGVSIKNLRWVWISLTVISKLEVSFEIENLKFK